MSETLSAPAAAAGGYAVSANEFRSQRVRRIRTAPCIMHAESPLLREATELFGHMTRDTDPGWIVLSVIGAAAELRQLRLGLPS